MTQPTVEQVAWVFDCIVSNAVEDQGGTFRHLIYDRMGFASEDYQTLYSAGGMAINNGMLVFYHPEYKEQ